MYYHLVVGYFQLDWMWRNKQIFEKEYLNGIMKVDC
jgi:hypothetical protein